MKSSHAVALLGMLAMLSACCQTYVSDWSAGELRMVGVHDGREDESTAVIAFDVKNVEGSKDGRYSIKLQVTGRRDEVRVDSSGVLYFADEVTGCPLWRRELPSPNPSMVDDSGGPRPFDLVKLDASEVRKPKVEPRPRRPEDAANQPVIGALIKRDDDSTVTEETYLLDEERGRWIRLQRFSFGHGTQWAGRRVVGWVAYPVAVILDVVLSPLYLIRNQGDYGCCLGPIPL